MIYARFGSDNLQRELKEATSNPGSGWFLVGANAEAVYGKFFKLVNGVDPTPMTQEEMAGMHIDLAAAALYWAFVTKRTFLLQESYWAVQPDNGLTEAKRQEWINYRAALQALPDSTSLTAPLPVRPSA